MAASQTPFQLWFAEFRRRRSWSLRDSARSKGVSATTAFHYQEGTLLPAPRVQLRLAKLAGTEPQHVAGLVAESRAHRLRDRKSFSVQASPDPPRRTSRRDRLPRPLGLALTMYRTPDVPAEYLERLRAVAVAHETTLGKVLRDALRLGLNRLEAGDVSL